MTLKDVLLKLQEMQLVALEKGIRFDIEGNFGYFDPVDEEHAPSIEAWSRDEDGEVLNMDFVMWRKDKWEKNLKIVESWIM